MDASHRTPSIGVTACCVRRPIHQRSRRPMTATAFRIGANWRWNSGGLAKRTFRAFRRNLAGPRRAGRGVPRRPGSRRSTRARLKTVTPLPSRSCTDTPTLRNSPHARPYSIIERWQAPSRLQGRWWQRSLRLSFLFGVTSPLFWPAPPAPFAPARVSCGAKLNGGFCDV